MNSDGPDNSSPREKPEQETEEQQQQQQQVLERWISLVRETLNSSPPCREQADDLPCEILPWLFLASQAACTNNIDALATRLGMTHVMTVNAQPPPRVTHLEWSYRAAGIEHAYYVPAYDYEGYNMLGKHWEATCRPILKQVRETPNAKIVVHCAAGQNRSGLIVGAALVDLEGWSLMRVIRTLKAKRGVVLTNTSFQRELCELAQRLDQLG